MQPPLTLIAAASCGLLAAPAAAQSPLYTFHGNSAGDRLGTSVSDAGDVDGDGVGDLIVGAPMDDPSGRESGSVEVRSGANGMLLHAFQGKAEGDEYGYSVSGAGDVNLDGHADVLIGIPGADTQGGMNSGAAELRDGKTGALLSYFNGYTAGARLGTSVSGAGDMNGDGVDDLLLGAPFDEDGPQFVDCGSVRVISGKSSLNLAVWYGFSKFGQFGWSVSDAGDVDGDGHADVIVGAPFGFHDQQYGVGSALVISGKSMQKLASWGGSAYGSQFGFAVSGAGDVDGDGLDDVIVGAPNDASGGIDAGRAIVYSPVKQDSSQVLLDLVGPVLRGKLGSAVSGVGDVDLDGHDDVLVGAPHHSLEDGAYHGVAWLFSGAKGLWIAHWIGQAGDRLGASLSGAGDLAGDAAPEVLIGARMHDGTAPNAGAAYVHRVY